MAGRELIRELHEASYRRIVIELLAYADDLRTAEDAAREAFADAYRNGRAVDEAASPHDELRRRALEVCRRRAGRGRLRTALRRRKRPPTTALAAVGDTRLSDDSNTTLAAVVALPPEQREAVVLHFLLDLSASDVAQAVSCPPATVNARLAAAGPALRAALGPGGRRYRERLGDLAIDVRQAIGMPAFADVVATASQHRRRMVASVMAVAALVGVGVVASIGRSPSAPRTSADDAATPSAQTAAVRRALQAPGTTMYAVARNADGVWASFWFCRSCAVERSFALLSRDGFLHVTVAPLFTDGQGDAWAAPTGDFVVSSGINGVLQVVSPDGAVRNVGGLSSGPARPAGPDDLVVTSYGVGPPNVPMVIDPQNLRQWPLRVPTFHDPSSVVLAQSYPDGDVWGLHTVSGWSGPGVVHSTDGGRTWSSHLFPSRSRDVPAVSPFGRALVSDSGAVAFLSLPLMSPTHPELVYSADGGEQWQRRRDPRDTDGRAVRVLDATLTPAGSVLVAGVDADGTSRVWLGSEGADGYRSLRPVLQESVTFVPSPLDQPEALWATAPQAIWQSDNGGRTWDLLVSHQAWQHLEVIGG